MASPAQDYHRGEMKIDAQASTFHGFIGLIKWSSLAIATAVLFLSVWLCAHANFFQALIVAVIVMAIGIVLLKEKPSAGH